MTSEQISKLTKKEVEQALAELYESVEICRGSAQQISEMVANGEISEERYLCAMDYYAPMLDEINREVLKLNKRLEFLAEQKTCSTKQPKA